MMGCLGRELVANHETLKVNNNNNFQDYCLNYLVFFVFFFDFSCYYYFESIQITTRKKGKMWENTYRFFWIIFF